MASPYADPDQVRRFLARITSAVAADAELNTRSTSDVDPAIDSALSGRGAPFTTTPDIVAVIASRLVAADVVDDKLSQTDDESRWSANQRKIAWDLIKKIKAGELGDSAFGTAALARVADADRDRPETEIFTSEDETKWQARTEVRET